MYALNFLKSTSKKKWHLLAEVLPCDLTGPLGFLLKYAAKHLIEALRSFLKGHRRWIQSLCQRADSHSFQMQTHKREEVDENIQ